MNKSAKKISIFIGIAMILIVGLVSIITNNSHKNENSESKKTIAISIYNKESENIYKENINTDKQYLIEVLDENKDLDIITEDSQYGKYITSIKGIEQGDNYYWSYYIDGEYAKVGVSNCKIEDGKTYDFKIESMNY